MQTYKSYKAGQATSIDKSSRTVTAVISTEDVDRHNEIVDQEGLDTTEFMKNPVVLTEHIPIAELTIGRVLSIKQTNSQTEAVIKFADEDTNPYAEFMWKMVRDGIINAVSIGFRVLDYVRDTAKEGVTRLTKTELLELSFVPIPANQNAVVKSESNDLTAVETFINLKNMATKTTTAKADCPDCAAKTIEIARLEGQLEATKSFVGSKNETPDPEPQTPDPEPKPEPSPEPDPEDPADEIEDEVVQAAVQAAYRKEYANASKTE